MLDRPRRTELEPRPITQLHHGFPGASVCTPRSRRQDHALRVDLRSSLDPDPSPQHARTDPRIRQKPVTTIPGKRLDTAHSFRDDRQRDRSERLEQWSHSPDAGHEAARTAPESSVSYSEEGCQGTKYPQVAALLRIGQQRPAPSWHPVVTAIYVSRSRSAGVTNAELVLQFGISESSVKRFARRAKQAVAAASQIPSGLFS